jgi:hypothetical protein
MPARRSEWHNPILHIASVLFGTGLGFVMIFPLMAILSYSIQIPGVWPLLSYIMPRNAGWAFVMFLLVSWIAGVAATYAMIAWAIKPRPDSPSDQAN